MTTDLRILFATPECAPWVKTGGLGDVSATLPAALHAAGYDIRVLLPGYLAILSAVDRARASGDSVEAGELPGVGLREATVPRGVPALVAGCPAPFDRRGT